MFKFLIDIFFKDAEVGLSKFSDIRSNRIYKNRQNNLFKFSKDDYEQLNNNFTDPIACHL